MAREFQVTFDCADPGALAGFWAEALGYEFDAPPSGFDSWDAALDAWGVPKDQRNDAAAVHDPDGSGSRLYFQRVPEGKSAKNRLHLDLRAAPGLQDEARMAALDAESERLVALGATQLKRHEPAPPMSQGFITLADPEGNEFCLD